MNASCTVPPPGQSTLPVPLTCTVLLEAAPATLDTLTAYTLEANSTTNNAAATRARRDNLASRCILPPPPRRVVGRSPHLPAIRARRQDGTRVPRTRSKRPPVEGQTSP